MKFYMTIFVNALRLLKRLDGPSWISAPGLPFTYPTLFVFTFTLFVKKIRVSLSPKVTVHFSGTVSQILNLENFATARRSSQRAVNLKYVRCGR